MKAGPSAMPLRPGDAPGLRGARGRRWGAMGRQQHI